MDHTIVHFEIPADQPGRAANFYRELFGWDIQRWEGSAEEIEGMADYRPDNFFAMWDTDPKAGVDQAAGKGADNAGR